MNTLELSDSDGLDADLVDDLDLDLDKLLGSDGSREEGDSSDDEYRMCSVI